MFEPNQYELLDFGAGRKLERFGGEVLDRPSPAAENTPLHHRELWGSATARFDVVKGGKGTWDDSALRSRPDDEAPWSVQHGKTRLLMQLNAAGNVGIFPEQANNWDWIANQVRQCGIELADRAPRVLNLFAYTGGASLAAAAAGAEVTHIDSSGPTVAWAKRNGEASGLADKPIRWLVDDAVKFVARECRRGNRYDGVILDPPTYGKGPKGKPFKFREHLDELMESCGQLLEPEELPGRFLLFSCHAPGFETADAETSVARVLPNPDEGHVTCEPLSLEGTNGRMLEAGVAARWTSSGWQD